MRLSNSRKLSLVAGAVVAGLGLVACAGGDGDSGATTLKLASPIAADSPSGALVEQWIERVQEESKGTLEIETFYSGSLLSAEDTYPGVADGRADIAVSSHQYHPSELPLTSIVGLPFVTDDTAAYTLAVRDLYEQSNPVKAEWENNLGVEVLYFLPNSSALLASKNPIESVDQLDGLQIRAVGELASAMELVGANVHAISYNEVYESAQRGLVDAGTSSDMVSLQGNSVYEVLPNLADAGLGVSTVSPVAINPNVLESLSEEAQDAFATATSAYYDEFSEVLESMETETCETLKSEGVTFSAWNDSAKKEWDPIKKQVHDAWVEKNSTGDADASALLDTYTGLVESYEGDTGYTPAVTTCLAG